MIVLGLFCLLGPFLRGEMGIRAAGEVGWAFEASSLVGE